MRVVFMGSPEFALPTLRRLIASEHDIVAVVTQPDRPAGRGRGLRPPPVKELALERGLPVLQPKSVNALEALDAVRELAPDVLVIAAFGQILKQPLLDIPARGSLNVHASLLPKYRGAAPVAGALLAGEVETGVTIMEVVLALDAGPMVAQRSLPIEPQDTAATLTAKIAELGADLLVEVLPAWAKGEIAAEPQDEALATYVKPVHRNDALIDWSLPASEVWRRVRAYNPWPVATTTVDGEPLRILEALPLGESPDVIPGTVFGIQLLEFPDGQLKGGTFGVRCGERSIAVVRAQRAGRKAMSGIELLRGWGALIGKQLGG